MWDSEPDLEALHRFHGMLSTDPVAALAGLKELADRGSTMSMVYIAEAYRNGTGTGVDLLQSNEWFRRATDAGSMLASYELARNYRTAKDHEKAIEMLSLGAENRYPPSMHMLGACYATGSRVPKNLNKARETEVGGGGLRAPRGAAPDGRARFLLAARARGAGRRRPRCPRLGRAGRRGRPLDPWRLCHHRAGPYRHGEPASAALRQQAP